MKTHLVRAVFVSLLGAWVFVTGVNMAKARIERRENIPRTEVTPGTKARNGAVGGLLGAGAGIGTWLVVGTVGLATGGAGIAVGLGVMTAIGAVGGGLAGTATGKSTTTQTWVETIVHNDPAYNPWMWGAVLVAGLLLLTYGAAEMKRCILQLRKPTANNGVEPIR